MEVTDSTGRVITATTRLLQPVALDSIQTIPFQDTLLSILTLHTDNPNETNFYYRTYHKTEPIADNETEAGQEKNRRVNIKVQE